MGLDISAYSKLKKLDVVFDADGDPIDPQTREPLEGDYVRVHVNDDFPGRAEGLEDKAVYAYAEATSFRAGSYGGYNRWREDLARLAGYPLGKYEQYGRDWDSHCVSLWNGAQGPFAELINFSDCEGVIGPVVAAKLLADFRDFDARAQEFASNLGWFYENYQHWTRAFELAADGGAVDFH